MQKQENQRQRIVKKQNFQILPKQIRIYKQTFLPL